VVRVVTQLRNEAERLKERNDELREKVKELKVILLILLYHLSS
jgi:cell division septum initiation protein DivIVA